MLQSSIAEGRLRPGERVFEKELSQQLGVSRTPIREALLKLETEGLVVCNSRRSYNVRILTVGDVKDIYVSLGILEGVVVGSLPKNLTAQDLGLLEQYNERMKQAVSRGDLREFGRWNIKFHDVFLDKFGNRTLRKLCDSLRRQLYAFPVRPSTLKQWLEKSVREHTEIIRLARAGDTGGLESFFRNVHWSYEKNLRYIEDAFDKDGDVPMPL